MELLTHTKMRSFQNCARYFYHKHVEHLQPRYRSGGRRRGTLFGNALFYLQQAFEIQYVNAEGVVMDGSEEEIYLWTKDYLANQFLGLLSSGTLPHDEVPKVEVEIIKIGVMVCTYVEKYGIDKRREIEYVLPLINPKTKRSSRRFKLAGKMDGCIIFPGKKVDIIEDKFMGQIQKAMIERLALDSQSSEYVDAFIAKGWTARVRYRHTKLPGKNPLPPREYVTKDDYPGETPDEFEERLFEDVRENPDAYFDEQVLYFPTDHMDDYRKGRWSIGQAIIAASHGSDFESAYPRNDSRCWEYGGCEFIPLCTKVTGAQDLYIADRSDNPELSVTAETYGQEAV